jgi:hypothetical protein
LFVRAVGELAGVDVAITGDPRRAPAGLLESAAPNVTFVGYLRGDHYVDAIARADLIVTLTTEATSVMRAACEAVWAERPLLLTDSPATRGAFPFAVHVHNDIDAIKSAITALRDDLTTATTDLAAAREAQEKTWTDQLSALRSALNGLTTAIR